MVVARGWKKWGIGSYCLIGIVSVFQDEEN